LCRYTHNLEETVINALATLGVKGERSHINTGVWVGKNKVCAVGVTASRWVTMHGLAINVTPDLSNYDLIIPCGIKVDGRSVCSVQQSSPTVTLEIVLNAFLTSFSNTFDLEFDHCHLSSLQDTMDLYPELSLATLNKLR
jgi:lipoyl(octanoyl) transferase